MYKQRILSVVLFPFLKRKFIIVTDKYSSISIL